MLEKIRSIDEFTRITKEVKKRVGNINSNCFMMPDEINWYIAQGRLYHEQITAGELIICDEAQFYSLYYYTNPNLELDKIKVNKPVIINFVEHELRPSKKVMQMKERWSQVGFLPYTSTKRMLRANQSEDFEKARSCITNIAKQGLTVEFAKAEDVGQIMDIWHSSLDDLLHPLFLEKVLLTQIKNHEIICIFNEEEQVLGALQYEKTANSMMLWYVAVDSSLRNRGAGHALVYKMIELSLNASGKNTSVWVVDDNHGAIRFYKNIGYQFDGLYSQRYLLR